MQDSGADTNHKLQIISASQGTVTQGIIEKLSLVAGMRATLEISVEEAFPGTMRVIADAV